MQPDVCLRQLRLQSSPSQAVCASGLEAEFHPATSTRSSALAVEEFSILTSDSNLQLGHCSRGAINSSEAQMLSRNLASNGMSGKFI